MRWQACVAVLLSLALLPSCSLVVGLQQCSTTAECVQKGPDFANTLCSPDHFCVPLLSQDCSRILGGPVDDNTIVLGHMTTLSGPNASFGAASVPAADLALSEIQAFAMGVPTDPSQKAKQLAIVVCDDAMDDKRAATHLVADLHVPEVIGPVLSATTLDVANNVTVPAGVLILNPFSVSPLLSQVEKSGLVWRTSTSNAPEPLGMAPLVTQIEQQIRKDVPLMPSDKIRLAIMARDDLYGKGLADTIFPVLTINGTKVTDDGSNLLRKDLPLPGSNPGFDEAGALNAIVQFAPNIILVFGTAEMVARIGKIETAWPGGMPLPYYVMSEGLKVQELRNLAGSSNRDLTRRGRVFAPRPNASYFQGFKTRWNARFKQDLPEVYGTTTTYDAVYLSAYALATLRGQPITGANLAKGLKKTVPPGKLIPAGSTNLVDGFNLLQKGTNIDYDGVSGRLDFDVTTGEAPDDFDILCLQGSPVADFFSAQVFNVAFGDIGPFQTCP